jgi:site-specific recombinase XerD
LGYGIRVSELVGLNVNDYDSKKNTIQVSRKGGNDDIIFISTRAAADLNEYLRIRKKRYRPERYENALFLPTPESSNFSAGRLKVRAVQALIEKYAMAFGRPYLTVHKLRHSFGSNHYDENKDIEALRKQLGHQDGKTTQIYSHVLSEVMQLAVERADS